MDRYIIAHVEFHVCVLAALRRELYLVRLMENENPNYQQWLHDLQSSIIATVFKIQNLRDAFFHMT